jgi:hypothetical protein
MEWVGGTMSKVVVDIGLDVHAETIAAAGKDGDVCHQGTIRNDLRFVDKFLARHPCEGITTNHSNQHE